jgi:hypothetical protein
MAYGDAFHRESSPGAARRQRTAARLAALETMEAARAQQAAAAAGSLASETAPTSDQSKRRRPRIALSRRYARLATLGVLICSALIALGAHHVRSTPLTSAERTGFITTCAAKLTVSRCTCLLHGLQARGYGSVTALTSLFDREDAALTDGHPERGPADLRAALTACAKA